MYPPSEDSFFFSEFLSSYFKKLKKHEKQKLKFLDIGTGSGILAQTAKQAGIKDITAVDIDEEVIKHTKKIKGVKAIHSNLFSKIKKSDKFNIIVFNAPYLPEEETGFDNKADTTGGKTGDEIPINFLKQANQHLAKGGKIFLLISSLTPMNKIRKFSPKTAAKKRIFFEDLIILEFS